MSSSTTTQVRFKKSLDLKMKELYFELIGLDKSLRKKK